MCLDVRVQVIVFRKTVNKASSTCGRSMRVYELRYKGREAWEPNEFRLRKLGYRFEASGYLCVRDLSVGRSLGKSACGDFGYKGRRSFLGPPNVL